MSKIRVTYFCGAATWGGAEVFLGYLLGALGEDVQPSVVGVDPQVVARLAEVRPGTSSRVVPRIRNKRDLRAIRAQRRALIATRPDIVQVNLPVPFAEPWTVLAAASIRSSRIVVVEHLPMPIPRATMRLLKRISEPLVAAHVAVGEATARSVETMVSRQPGSVRVIHNGVPILAPRSPDRRSEGDLVLAGIGRLDPQKGFDLLIRALAVSPGTRLVLVGEGRERAALEGLALRLGVQDRVTWTGWVSQPPAVPEGTDVLVLSSRYEGFPLVVIEAMHLGIPVVACDVGSVREAVRNEETGLLVEPENVDALVGAIARLREEPALRADLADRAQRHASRHFTSAAMASHYQAIYREVTHHPRPR